MELNHGKGQTIDYSLPVLRKIHAGQQHAQVSNEILVHVVPPLAETD